MPSCARKVGGGGGRTPTCAPQCERGHRARPVGVAWGRFGSRLTHLLHRRRPGRDQLLGADCDAAAHADREAVRLGELAPVDRRARPVHVVAHHVHRLVDPLPEDGLSRRGRDQHPDGRDGVHRHEGAHPAGQEHLLAGHGVDDRVLHPLRVPQLRVRRARFLALGVAAQQVDLGLELVVRDEQRARVDHLAEVREASGIGTLVVPASRRAERRHCLLHLCAGPQRVFSWQRDLHRGSHLGI